MRKIIPHEKNQKTLFARHYVGDRLEDDDEVYQFDKLILSLDTSSVTNNYSPVGGSLYDPLNMLSILIYAYFEGITSSRKIEKCVRKSIPYIYLAGGNQIKHHSICDFRKKHLIPFRSILSASIRLALDSGLVKESDLFSLDGSKIEADASRSMTKRKKKWEAKESDILKHVENFLEKWIQTDKEEDTLEEMEKERIKKASAYFDELLEQRKQRCAFSSQETKSDKDKKEDKKPNEQEQHKQEEKKDKKNTRAHKGEKHTISDISECELALNLCSNINKAIEKNPEASETTLLNLTDPDCRVMKSDSTTKECFNTQIITNNQVIVAADVTNQENDQHQLKPMLDQLENNLKPVCTNSTSTLSFQMNDQEESLSEKEPVKEEKEKIKLAADAGYNRGENLEYLAEQEDINAFVSMNNRKEEKDREENPYHRDHFTYSEDKDNYTCPAGKELENYGEKINGDKKETIYACNLETCQKCPFNSKCIQTKIDRKKGYRTIVDDGFNLYRREMKAKMREPESKEIYNQRGCEVEPVFGQMTYNRSFRRFRLRGLDSVKGEFMIAALAHNLGKIMRYQAKNTKNKEVLSNSS